jgi:hypothetical protein
MRALIDGVELQERDDLALVRASDFVWFRETDVCGNGLRAIPDVPD